MRTLLPGGRRPVGIYWPNIEKLDKWVKDVGCNVLIYNQAISARSTDWDTLHAKIASLRSEGYPVWVIRYPAPYLDYPKPASFDVTWRDHLLAYSLRDEIEDKTYYDNGTWVNYNSDPGYVAMKAVQQAQTWKSVVPGIPVFANFNGLHIDAGTKASVKAMYQQIAAECSMIAADNYMGTALQVRQPDGTLRYKLAGHWRCTDALRQWCPDKIVLGCVDTANQEIYAEGQQSSVGPGYTHVASRAPTPAEICRMAARHPEGWFYFAMARSGAVNDATPDSLLPILRQISRTAAAAVVRHQADQAAGRLPALRKSRTRF